MVTVDVMSACDVMNERSPGLFVCLKDSEPLFPGSLYFDTVIQFTKQASGRPNRYLKLSVVNPSDCSRESRRDSRDSLAGRDSGCSPMCSWFAAFARLPLLMELLGAPKSLEKCIISPLINQLA